MKGLQLERRYFFNLLHFLCFFSKKGQHHLWWIDSFYCLTYRNYAVKKSLNLKVGTNVLGT